MNKSTDAIISIALDRQAERLHQIQAVSLSRQAGLTPPAGNAPLAVAMACVIIATLLLAFIVH